MTIPDHRKQASDALAAASSRTYEIVKTVDATYRKRHELPKATTTILIFGNLYTESQMREYGQQCREADALRKAAQAVVDRWDTPSWKDAPATADYINELREALK